MAMSVVYTTFAGRIVHENRGGEERFYGQDTLASTAALYDKSGNQTDTYDYWPYGEIRSHTGSSKTPFTFVGTLGYYMDQLTQLYVRARYLTTNLARWLTVDPLWPREKAYGYARSAPQSFTDRSGLGPCDQNACSKLGTSPSGICIAAMCSMDSAVNLLSILQGMENSGELGEDIWNWVKDQLRDAGSSGLTDPRDGGPDDCCAEANSGRKSGLIPSVKARIIGYLCHRVPKSFRCLGTMKTLRGCCKCCTQMLPKSGQGHLMCQIGCESRFNEPGGCGDL